MPKKREYKRKFKDGEHNYHLKKIKKNAVKKALSKIVIVPHRLNATDYALIVVAVISLLFVIFAVIR